MSFISFTLFCISFRTSFIKFYKFYNVLYVSCTEPARWASPGPIPWPAGASPAQTVAAVSEPSNRTNSSYNDMPTLEGGMLTLECGMLILECGMHTLEGGMLTLECGMLTLECGMLTLECDMPTLQGGMLTL